MSEDKTVTVVIDDLVTEVEAGQTIMQAADQIGIRIPRLCYHPNLSILGACRICVVEVEGQRNPVAACSFPVAEGQKICTSSPLLRKLRRDIIELLLDNHPKDCQTCERCGNCELQDLAYDLGVRERLYEGERKQYARDTSSPAVIRDPEKCILCGRCVRVCSEVQGVTNLSQQHRGFTNVVAPAHDGDMQESVCIQCGQCINVCPTAAFVENSSTDAVLEALADTQKHVVVHTAPSIRAAVGEGFGFPPGTPVTGKMVEACRLMGFDQVFDTNFSADLTIVEEATEFLSRLTSGEKLPLITSCSPGWVNFMEHFYPELIPLASTCKSPMSMLSTLLKTFYAEKMGIDPKSIYVVAIMPCTAKKFEAQRPEHLDANGTPYTDAVLTTREFIWLAKCLGVDFQNLPDSEFDNPLGESSGAGDIFGATGGVMEAALRTAYEKVTGKTCPDLDFTVVRGVEGVKEATIDIEGTAVSIAVANGLNNAKSVLDAVIAGEKNYHLIEIMACPGGCVAGGGQPYPPQGMDVLDPDLAKLRAQALYSIDSHKNLRKSHENPSIIKLYEEFLGEPNGHKSHELLHTAYAEQHPRGVR
ncbi:MAG: iron hydrogenase small subunit [Kiritimatiellae bacterium]|nr:iron hydrogenase small subunit [Kiritimatiellia bacterium]